MGSRDWLASWVRGQKLLAVELKKQHSKIAASFWLVRLAHRCWSEAGVAAGPDVSRWEYWVCGFAVLSYLKSDSVSDFENDWKAVWLKNQA